MNFNLYFCIKAQPILACKGKDTEHFSVQSTLGYLYYKERQTLQPKY